MATLSGKKIADTFDSILHVADEDGPLTGTPQVIEDGLGNDSALKLATNSVEIRPSAADTAQAFEVNEYDNTPILSVDTTGGDKGVIINQNHQADIDFRVEGDAKTHLLFVDASADKIGIGTSTPDSRLVHINDSSGIPLVLERDGVSTGCSLQIKNDTASAYIGINSAENFAVHDTSSLDDASLTFMIDEARLAVAEGNNTHTPLHTIHARKMATTGAVPLTVLCLELSDSGGVDTVAGEGPGIAFLVADESPGGVGNIGFATSNCSGYIACVRESGTDTGGQGALTFATADNNEGAQDGSHERMRISSAGLVRIGNTNLNDNLSVRGSASRIIKAVDTAVAATDVYFYEGAADDNSDVNFQVTTAGVVKAESTAITELDYAEFFESDDGAAIERGTTVVLIDGKVRAAKDGESPFGVVRPNGVSSVVGGEPLKWYKKHLRDDYGVILLDDDGGKKLNPDYVENPDTSGSPDKKLAVPPVEDSDGNLVGQPRIPNPDWNEYYGEQIYERRADRDEWQIVGLLGQIQIAKGQPVASSWIKMSEVSSDVDMYYVFPCPQVII